MIHLKRFGFGAIAGVAMFSMAAFVSAVLIAVTVLGGHAFGRVVDLSGVGIVNSVSLVLFSIQLWYIVGCAAGRYFRDGRWG